MKKLYLFLILLIFTTTLKAAINVSITNPLNSRDTICQGLTQLITTNVSGVTGNITYQWKKNSQILSNSGSTYINDNYYYKIMINKTKANLITN